MYLLQAIRPDGSEAVKHADSIAEILDRTLHMTNITAHTFACNILERYLRGIGSIYPRDMNSVSTSLDKSVEEYLPIRVSAGLWVERVFVCAVAEWLLRGKTNKTTRTQEAHERAMRKWQLLPEDEPVLILKEHFLCTFAHSLVKATEEFYFFEIWTLFLLLIIRFSSQKLCFYQI